MKPREDERHEPRASLHPYPGVPLFCRNHLSRVWLSWQASAKGSREVYPLVFLFVSCRRNWNRLANVPLLSIICAETACCVQLTVFFSGCYRKYSGRGSSVVEQPIRNRQVVGSTPTLGSSYSWSSPTPPALLPTSGSRRNSQIKETDKDDDYLLKIEVVRCCGTWHCLCLGIWRRDGFCGG